MTAEQKALYNEFLSNFSLEKLKTMTLEEYTNPKRKVLQDRKQEDSFCYWIEYKLDAFGSIKGGSAFKFGIYCQCNELKENTKTNSKVGYDETYVWKKAFGEDAAMAYSKVLGEIVRIAEAASKGDYEEIDKNNNILWPSVRWKIAFLYSPGELDKKQIIPIYGVIQLKTIASKMKMQNVSQASILEIQNYLRGQQGTKSTMNYGDELWKLVPQKTKDISSDGIMENTVELTDKIQELLYRNRNIILHGAPGTGKTYLAREIAKAMCYAKDIKKLEESGQFKMVQFHPSYDYTDFVEGLRPTGTDRKGNIIFSRKDGVFKAFCKRVIKTHSIVKNDSQANIIASKDQLNKVWNELIEEIKQKGTIQLQQKGRSKDKHATGKRVDFSLYKDTLDTIALTLCEDKNNFEKFNLEKCEKIFKSENYNLNKIENLSPKEVGEKSGVSSESYAWAVVNELRIRITRNLISTSSIANTYPRYVFLIDEINRGDISKIFGELFFSIDPGYRGEEGKIDTQYQNLIPKEGDKDFKKEDADPFRKGFYIPDNVYIIGTMNDIDRSVESMDFAMRRRFQFIEIKAEDRVDDMFCDDKTGEVYPNADKAKNRMTNLNNCISDKSEKGVGLSSSYHIGPSYFIDFAKDKESVIDLWNYRLEGLLREYLRGEDESVIDEKLGKLKTAFGIKTENGEDEVMSV